MKKTRHRDPLDVIGIIITYLLAAFEIAVSLSPFLFWYLDCRSGGERFSPGYMTLGAIGLFFTIVTVDTIIETRKVEKKEEQELIELANSLVKWAEDFKRDYAKLKKKARKRDIDKK